MRLRIGYKASAEQFGPRELADCAVHAEGVGLDSVFVADHFQPWRHEGGHAAASIPWLAHVAARTQQVLLGTSVMAPTFRYNPAVLAQTFATLACLHPGRIILGVGTGEALNEIASGALAATTEDRDQSATSWPDFSQRFARLREAVELMGQLWTRPRVTFEGTYYRTHMATIYDRPPQPIPVYVAAGGPVVADYAGRVADGIICTSGKGHDHYAQRLIPAVVAGAHAAGRAVSQLDRMIEIKLSYHPDLATARENTRYWAPLALPAQAKHSIGDPGQMQAAADALPIEHIASRWIVADKPEQVIEQVRGYTDLGFNHLVFHSPEADQRAFLDRFARDVLAGLRELTAIEPA